MNYYSYACLGVLKNGNLLHKWSLVETQLLRTVYSQLKEATWLNDSISLIKSIAALLRYVFSYNSIPISRIYNGAVFILGKKHNIERQKEILQAPFIV